MDDDEMGIYQLAHGFVPLISLAEQFERLLEWLCPSFLDPEAHQEQLREMCAPLTGSWIRKHQLFKNWLDLTASSLWMRGTCTVKILPLPLM